MYCKFLGRHYYNAIYLGAFLWKPYISFSIHTIKCYRTYCTLMFSNIMTVSLPAIKNYSIFARFMAIFSTYVSFTFLKKLEIASSF